MTVVKAGQCIGVSGWSCNAAYCRSANPRYECTSVSDPDSGKSCHVGGWWGAWA